MTHAFVKSLTDQFEANLFGVTPIQEAIRKKAWERFLKLGLPTKKLPGYQYFPLTQFFQERFERTESLNVDKDQFTPLIYPECDHSHIVFLNGQYAPDLSDTSGLPEEVVVMPLSDSLHSYGNFLQARITRTLKEEIDPFALLNIALIQQGLFLYIPPGIQLTNPIQCLQLTSHDKPAIYSPRIHAVLGKNASATWITDTHCLKDYESFTNAVFDLTLEEGATFQSLESVSPCSHSWYFESKRASLRSKATFKTFSATQGCRSLRQDAYVQLLGKNASCDLQGLSLLDQKNQSHTNIHITHKAPSCHSNQLFKGILNGSSRSSFEGKIYVHPTAQQTEAYQLNRSLLLSDNAQSNTKPNLEIFADDVSASHGATVTQLQESDLFYLKSRGVSTQKAKHLLIAGFATEIIPTTFKPYYERTRALIEKAT